MIEQLSLRIFGTPDYQSVLEILPPYDGMVLQFMKESKELGFDPFHKDYAVSN